VPDIAEFSIEAKDSCSRAHVWTKDVAEILQVPELCWGFSLIFISNYSSFTDEGGGAELRQLDTTGCGRSQNSSGTEIIEFQ